MIGMERAKLLSSMQRNGRRKSSAWRVHRDPFEPIMRVLEAESPLGEYRKITEEIVKRMPDESRYPRAAAVAEPRIGFGIGHGRSMNIGRYLSKEAKT